MREDRGEIRQGSSPVEPGYHNSIRRFAPAQWSRTKASASATGATVRLPVILITGQSPAEGFGEMSPGSRRHLIPSRSKGAGNFLYIRVV
jgi:hypothetical protein